MGILRDVLIGLAAWTALAVVLVTVWVRGSRRLTGPATPVPTPDFVPDGLAPVTLDDVRIDDHELR